MISHEVAALALQSMAAGEPVARTLHAIAAAISSQVPRCLVAAALASGDFEAARAGAAVEIAEKERLVRLVSTGNLPLDLLALPEAHRNRWVEPLQGLLDPARYAASPVGTFMRSLGVFYFGRHFVCDGPRFVASVAAWLPLGVERFDDDEVTALSTSAATVGPLLRLLAVATHGAAYEAAVMRDAEQRGQAAYLVAPSGAVVAASTAGAALLAAQPALRGRLEVMGVQDVERAFPAMGLRLHATVVPTAHGEHALVTAAPLQRGGAESLTARQQELLDYVEIGRSNREIGLVMGLSEATVKTMLQRLYARTGAANRVELIRWRRAD